MDVIMIRFIIRFINFINFLAYNTNRPPMSVHKKFQPNRSSRLAGYREHIYIRITNVFFFDK